ncbi:MAG: peptide-methionine (S)-S-oxide reductase MsrA [Akkermansiaceae bacterium]|nr:peptide-methionine (S)-S-oxide reductase MsrA [Armatimonadota bacterium]
MTRPFAITIAALCAASAGFAVWARNMATPDFGEAHLDRPARALAVPSGTEVAVFAGGCFWGTEEAFRDLPGVIATQTGYTGGTLPNPTYQTSHQKSSGYVEATTIIYDPKKVPYETLLDKFFNTHDPTAPRPGSPDSIGRAYRSFVFAQSAAQAKTARSVIASLNKTERFAFPIATQVRPASRFYPAEERHQLYYAKRDEAAKCLP